MIRQFFADLLCGFGFHDDEDRLRPGVTGWTIVERTCRRCGRIDLDIG